MGDIGTTFRRFCVNDRLFHLADPKTSPPAPLLQGSGADTLEKRLKTPLYLSIVSGLDDPPSSVFKLINR